MNKVSMSWVQPDYIKALANSPVFCKQYFQMHFLYPEGQFYILIQISQTTVPMCRIEHTSAIHGTNGPEDLAPVNEIYGCLIF